MSTRPTGRLVLLALAAAALGVAAQPLRAFVLLGPTWPDGNIVMHLQLGTPGSPLSDGAADWGAVAESALNEWNTSLTRVKFTAVRNSNATISRTNRINNVTFASTIYGQAFGTRVLAVTIGDIDDDTLGPTERDVIFNSNLTWDSYRGGLRGNTTEFRRVALHEFGHVLGLDHPDETETISPRPRAPQLVTALMRSSISGGVETLRDDDTAGARALYGAFPDAALAQSRTLATAGGAFTISVNPTGVGPFSYFWYFRPAGALFAEPFLLPDTASYTIGGVQPADAGTYTATATSTSTGAFFSTTATLDVTPVATSPDTVLANLSTRGFVGTGSDVLIAGLVIGGTGQKRVFIRAVGPALAGFGVTGALADPVLTVINTGTGATIATNDNWSETAAAAAIEAAAARRGAFPFAAGSRDAALLLELPPGNYTATVSGAGAATGVALIEAYDDDPDPATARSRRFINIATRGRVNGGENDLIAGLNVSGPGPRTYLIRAIGPTLLRPPFNLTGALRDPFLQIFRGTTLLRENDDIDGPFHLQRSLVDASARVGAFRMVEFRNESGLDSAMLVTLPPGSYTAKVSGFEGLTGVALVEIYEVP